MYRDVFYGAGPLAIWIQSVVFRLLRSQGIVVRTLTLAYFGAEVAAAIALVDDQGGAMLVAGAMVALGAIHLHPHNHYGHLSSAAVLWAAVAVLGDQPWLAGLALGAAILGRYSVGVAATALLAGAATVIGAPGDGGRVLVAALAPILVLVMVHPDAARWFHRRAVANKRGYLEVGRVAPVWWVRTRPWRPWDMAAWQTPVVVAMVVVVGAPAVCAWRVLATSTDEPIVGLALALCGAVVAYPRFDGPHGVAAALLSVPGVVVALVDPPVALGVAAWGLVLVGLVGRASLTRRRPYRRDLPSLKLLPVPRLSGGRWPDQTDDLPPVVFVLRRDAALVYACGGVSNPTPFDYPAASTFGPRGQAEVIAAIDAGLPVCHGWTDTADRLTPRALIEHLPASGGRPVQLGRLLVDEKTPPGV